MPRDAPHKKVMMCLVDKIHVLEKLCLVMDYNGVGREFDVNESIAYMK